jgi:hypothetical protein
MIMKCTGWILVRRAVEGPIQAIAMTQMTTTVRRTHRAVRKEQRNGIEQRLGRGN